MLSSSLELERERDEEGEALQKSGGGQVGNISALSERRHRGKKTFPMKILDLPGLIVLHMLVPGCC